MILSWPGYYPPFIIFIWVFGEAGRRRGSLKRLDQQLFAMLYLFSRVVPGLELFPLLLDDTES